MNEAYHKFPILNKISPKERVQAFKESTLFILQIGTKTIKQLESSKQDFIDEEQYEACIGIDLAINEFKNNSQTKLI